MKTFVLLTGVAVFSFISTVHADNNVKMSAASHENMEAAPSMEMLVAPAPAAEATLEVESWMTNENFFAPLAVAETEQPLEVEDWMMNSETFMETTFIPEADQALNVENWMMDQDNFTPISGEKALEVESWMLDQQTWGR